ncbi:MAG: O-antigen ligase family protein [Bacteroidales bacterium]|nr:O-antigen ligase family protein [Bacteroidales bacterium]
MINANQYFWRQSFFIMLVMLGMSIPLSRFAMSSFQFLLFFIWLLDGLAPSVLSRFFRKCNIFQASYHTIKYLIDLIITNIIDKTKLFWQNKTALVLASIFGLHLIGLLFTSDFDYAIKDLRTKIPLLLLPLMLASMPKLSLKQIHILLLFYLLAVFGGTIICLNEFLKQEFEDIRQISIFISPIRFSLNIVFSIFILIYFLTLRSIHKLWQQLVILLFMVWFISFLIILESAIGVVSIFIIGLGLFFYKMFSARSLQIRILMGILFISAPVIAYVYIIKQVTIMTVAPKIDFSKLDQYTKSGNKYKHDTINFGVEDGKYIGVYLATSEMAKAWNTRSKFDFSGYDEAEQLIQYTLIRYLTSKNLRKDAEGVNSLTAKDIRLVEKGIANINYVENPSINTRISKILLGYQRYSELHDPNGSSVMQRVEHWKASVLIIKENFWLGVGTGDLPSIFKETYERIDSPLKEQWRWRSHNQFLSIWIAFGIFGALWFLFTLVYPLVIHHNYRNYLLVVFFMILMLSMLTEDTIETQDGATLFAYFSALFTLSYPIKDNQSNEMI